MNHIDFVLENDQDPTRCTRSTSTGFQTATSRKIQKTNIVNNINLKRDDFEGKVRFRFFPFPFPSSLTFSFLVGTDEIALAVEVDRMEDLEAPTP